MPDSSNRTDEALRLRLIEIYAPYVGMNAVHCAREAYAFIVGNEQSLSAEATVSVDTRDGGQIAPERTGHEAKEEDTKWTPDLLQQFERLWASGMPAREIARKIGETDHEAVRRYARKYGIAARWPRAVSGTPLRPPYPLNAAWPPPPASEAQSVAEYQEAVSRKISECTKAALAKAKERGKVLGRQIVWTEAVERQAVEIMAGGTRRVREVCRKLKISPATLHKYSSAKVLKGKAAALLVQRGYKYEAVARKLDYKTWQEVRMIAMEAGVLAKDAGGRWISPNNDLAVTMPGLKPEKRKCLRCSKEFLSEGPHHRLCGRCRGNVAGEYDPEPMGRI